MGEMQPSHLQNTGVYLLQLLSERTTVLRAQTVSRFRL